MIKLENINELRRVEKFKSIQRQKKNETLANFIHLTADDDDDDKIENTNSTSLSSRYSYMLELRDRLRTYKSNPNKYRISNYEHLGFDNTPIRSTVKHIL